MVRGCARGPGSRGCHLRRAHRQLAQLRRPGAAPGRAPRRRRPATGRQGRARHDEPARVPRVVLRRVAARCGAGERQLPVRRRRGALRRSTTPTRVPSCTTRSSRAVVDDAVAALPRPSRGRARDGRPLRGRARRGRPRSGRRPAARRRRPDLPLHRRDDRHAQGRHVAQRRPVPRALADGASGHRAARPGRGGPGGQARRHVPAGVPAHARHRAVHHALDAGGRGHRGARRRDRPRRATPLVGGRALRRRGAHDRRRRVRSPAAWRRSTREPTRWDLSSLRAVTSSGVTWSPDVEGGAASPPATGRRSSTPSARPRGS